MSAIWTAGLPGRSLLGAIGARNRLWISRLLAGGAAAALVMAFPGAAGAAGGRTAGWTAQALTPPSGTFGGGLTGISCTATTSCAAVGMAPGAMTAAAMVYFWDGTTWTAQSIATLADSGGV